MRRSFRTASSCLQKGHSRSSLLFNVNRHPTFVASSSSNLFLNLQPGAKFTTGVSIDTEEVPLPHSWFGKLPKSVTIYEVGPRDGLQNEREILPTDVKIKLIDRLVGAGLKFVETTSFVSPKEIPQMSDAAELMKRLKKQPGVSYPVLVPNDKGFQNAINAGATDLAVFVAGSETFSQKNNKCPISVSLDRARSICEKAKAMNIKVRGYLSCVLGCPYEGYMNPAGIADLAEKLLQMGCYQVSLGDTIGVGSPGTTHRLLSEVSKKIDVEKIAVHFHDTYGQALANILTSLQVS